MKRIPLLLLAVMTAALLCACSSQPANLADDPIIGSWTLTSMASETETNEASDVETVYTFNPDGKVKGIDNGNTIFGTWKKTNASTYIVTTEDNTKMKFILDEDTLTYQLDFGGMTMVNFIFERK